MYKRQAQYSAGLDDRMKQQITETVQKVDDNLKDVEITDDDTLYGQIKGLGERAVSYTHLDVYKRQDYGKHGLV